MCKKKLVHASNSISRFRYTKFLFILFIKASEQVDRDIFVLDFIRYLLFRTFCY